MIPLTTNYNFDCFKKMFRAHIAPKSSKISKLHLMMVWKLEIITSLGSVTFKILLFSLYFHFIALCHQSCEKMFKMWNHHRSLIDDLLLKKKIWYRFWNGRRKKIVCGSLCFYNLKYICFEWLFKPLNKWSQVRS
jgi:hypothetical protein